MSGTKTKPRPDGPSTPPGPSSSGAPSPTATAPAVTAPAASPVEMSPVAAGPVVTSPADAAHVDVFRSFGRDHTGRLSPDQVLAQLHQAGILPDDPRIAETVANLAGARPAPPEPEPLVMTVAELAAATQRNSSIISKAARGELAVPDFPALVADIRRIYAEVVADTRGAVADYIPQLARVDADQFAISVCTVDGQRFSIGDAETDFCLQSVSKAVNYCLALDEHGPDTVHRHVGREPSGVGFNERF
ncbi:glutaminase [Kitasatospora sp. LaBMicrA B282]|uniref:glutaminase n=1 Tax=Kitasatospora sp. LaBMicrA B282 TaxID=3420949 RepID=UPI003D0EA86D